MGDCMGGEAAAGVSDPLDRVIVIISAASGRLPRGGAAAARWAHNPKVGGSNPSPATIWNRVGRQADAVLFFRFRWSSLEHGQLGRRLRIPGGLDVRAKGDLWKRREKRRIGFVEFPESSRSIVQAAKQVADVLVAGIFLA